MNGFMESLDGLNNIISLGGDITIEDNPLLTDFCGIRPVMVSDGFTGTYIANNNAFNPSFAEIINLSCD